MSIGKYKQLSFQFISYKNITISSQSTQKKNQNQKVFQLDLKIMAIKHSNEFLNLFSTPNYYFSIIGQTLLNSHKRDNPKRHYAKLIYFWVQLILYLSLGMGEGATFYLEIRSSKNFLLMTELLSYFGYEGMSLIKLLVFFIFRRKFWKIIDELNELYPKTAEAQEKYKVGNHMTHTLLITKIFSRICMAFIAAFNILPFLESLLQYRAEKNWTKRFTYPVWYPFNAYTTGVFEINYFLQVLCAFNGVSGLVAVDTLSCVIILQICMQFKILQQDIENIKVQNNNEDYKELCGCIEKHQKLIKLTETFDRSTSFQMLCTFLASSCVICMAGFIVVAHHDIFVLSKFILMLISSLIEVFVICWCGEKLVEDVS